MPIWRMSMCIHHLYVMCDGHATQKWREKWKSRSTSELLRPPTSGRRGAFPMLSVDRRVLALSSFRFLVCIFLPELICVDCPFPFFSPLFCSLSDITMMTTRCTERSVFRTGDPASPPSTQKPAFSTTSTTTITKQREYRLDINMSSQARVAEHARALRLSVVHMDDYEASKASKWYHLHFIRALLGEVCRAHRNNPKAATRVARMSQYVHMRFYEDEEDPYAEILNWISRQGVWRW